LFRDANDYYAAGGMPGSAGVYISGPSSRLMAIAGQKLDASTWHVIQHEGFHQFADNVIGGDMPPWLNEGIAEYFGESIFTGDGFVSGILPPHRVARVQDAIRNDRFPDLQRLMTMTLAQWNAALQGENYDMSWTLFHFLAHGDDGRYQKPFEQFMHAIGRGMDWQQAWRNHFGTIDGFEERWRDYWLNLDQSEGGGQYRRAALEGLTSYLARGNAAGTRFDSFDALVQAIRDDEIDMQDDPLPRSLADNIVQWMGEGLEVAVEDGSRNTQQVIATLPDRTVAVGTFELRRREVHDVSVRMDDLPPIIAQAKELIASGDKVKARQLLQQAIRDHPRSPFVREARQTLIETR
jgi:hypothetical protein